MKERMTHRIASHFRSNVVGYVTIFLALAGGTAYATHPGGTNTISSIDIINAEVRAADVATAAVNGGKLAANSVSSPKVIDNAVTGTDVNEDALNLGAEAWHEVGAAGEPPFNTTTACTWGNFDAFHSSAAFARDASGVVHLKGLVRAADIPATPGCSNFQTIPVNSLIFVLPEGYRPARREVHSTITNSALGRVNVDGVDAALGLPAGSVSVAASTAVADAKEWVSLDGISFRCAPSGANGCP